MKTGLRKAKRKKAKLFDGSRSQKVGNAPGTPIHVGQNYDFKPYITLLRYNMHETKEFSDISASDLKDELRSDCVNWVNIEGLHDITLVQSLAKMFELHPLTLEDIVNTSLRPQFENYPGYSFFALKMLYTTTGTMGGAQLTGEHASLILKGNILVTFQETPGDVWGRIRDRIRTQSGTVCGRGADYLLYLLLDSIVDGYFQVIDALGEKIDDVEESLQRGPRDTLLRETFELRREILILRKNIVPVRDLFNKAQVAGNVFQENTQIYLKDLTDHILQVTESLSLSMEMSNVLIDTYHSMQNQRLNEVMKTLTMMSTIFLPLNLIAGIYGMNFEHMPELNWVHGYPMVVSTMAIVAVLMILFFVHKGWIGGHRARPSSAPNEVTPVTPDPSVGAMPNV